MTQRSHSFAGGIGFAAFLCFLSAVGPAGEARAEERRAVGPAVVADIAAKAMPSVAIVSFTDRDGEARGVGTGFVVDSAGLIATNLHVIGEARPITVRFADGASHRVTAVHATDRASDLALLKIDAAGLDPLPLGNAGELRDGAEVIALGHPQGFEHSVVSGVLSGRRELEGKELLQLAIPVEPGNSGGPVLDRDGKVVGVLTMRSAASNNLGFAMPIDALASLIENPNPVPIDRWLTIGRLDPKRWESRFGGTWRQRAGHIHVSGPGNGFGGRTLLLSLADVPDRPFEVAVTVKLGDEAGAAGLVIGSDGDEQHFGFYPSAGGLRWSRFDGPDVFSWTVLEQVSSRAYRPGDWNTLKVRVEDDSVTAFVNDERIVEWSGSVGDGQLGLCAFRGTAAEFRQFRIAKEIPSATPDDETKTRILATLDSFNVQRPPNQASIDALLPDAGAAAAVLDAEAARLERRATAVRQLAAAVQQNAVLEELRPLAAAEASDLLRGALLIAKLDNPEIDVEAYLAIAERLADEARGTFDDDASDSERLAALDTLLFDQLGFHGSRTNYYHASNSYLNEVIDDREGLPVALSVLYIDLAQRLGLRAEGVGLPGHFVVRFVPEDSEPELIDVFDRARRLSRDDAEALAGVELDESAYAAVEPAAILDRILRNLLNLAQTAEDREATLKYVEAVLVLDPDSATDRLVHALVCTNTGRYAEALADCDQLLQAQPAGLDLARVTELRQFIERKRREAER